MRRGGRYLYGVGESPLVSRLSGIDNDRVIVAAYAISGLCAAVTGVLFTGFSTMAFLGMGDQLIKRASAETAAPAQVRRDESCR